MQTYRAVVSEQCHWWELPSGCVTDITDLRLKKFGEAFPRFAPNSYSEPLVLYLVLYFISDHDSRYLRGMSLSAMRTSVWLREEIAIMLIKKYKLPRITILGPREMNGNASYKAGGLRSEQFKQISLQIVCPFRFY